MHSTAPVASSRAGLTGRSGVLGTVLLMAAGTALLTLAAKVQVPFWPVPVTLQSMATLTLALLMGGRLATATVLAYLMEGALGLPVFAGATAGLSYMAGPTAGYLAGMVAAAALTGWMSDRGFARTVPGTALAALAGLVVIYLPGIAWLATLIGVPAALKGGLTPFLLAEAVKLSLVTVLVPQVKGRISKHHSVL